MTRKMNGSGDENNNNEEGNNSNNDANDNDDNNTCNYNNNINNTVWAYTKDWYSSCFIQTFTSCSSVFGLLFPNNVIFTVRDRKQ